MQSVEVTHGAATDVGRVRTVNEDSWLAQAGVFVVADGMGGHDGGDVASRLVVEEFARLAERGYDLDRAAAHVALALEAARTRLVAHAGEQRASEPDWHAGTTVVCAMLATDNDQPIWLLTNLGDSRIYRVQDQRLHQVSVDHSVVQELLDGGAITAEQAESHPERHVVTRALGTRAILRPDSFTVPLASAPRLLLCSDGVSGLLEHAVIERVLVEVADPHQAAEALVEAALAAGGHDNATAVVVDVVGLVPDHADSSTAQRTRIEQKLGAGR